MSKILKHSILSCFQTEITWILAMLAIAFTLFWLWTHMSHKHLMGIIFLTLYFYEVLISYKVSLYNPTYMSLHLPKNNFCRPSTLRRYRRDRLQEISSIRHTKISRFYIAIRLSHLVLLALQ